MFHHRHREFDVAAALIRLDSRYLLCQRQRNLKLLGRWEFPKGEIAFGESPADAISRELRESLQLFAREVEDVLCCYDDFASNSRVGFMPVRVIGLPELSRYVAMRWMTLEDLRTSLLSPADALCRDFLIQQQKVLPID